MCISLSPATTPTATIATCPTVPAAVPLRHVVHDAAWLVRVQVAAGVPVPLDTIRQIWGAGTRAGLYPLSPTTCYWYTCSNASEGG